MTGLIKRLVKQGLLRTETGKKLLLCYELRTHLDQIGWFRSVQEKLPVDRDGNCLPWFTYPAICFLSHRITPQMAVFEYGSGNSTLWWSMRVFRLVSCEHDPQWYHRLKEKVPANVEYLHRELVCGGEYCRAIVAYPCAFDIVVIDGRDRVNCGKNAVGALKPGGVIVWDNSDRDRYEEGFSWLVEHSFKRLDFEGHGPVNPDKWMTSIFYRDENCLGI